LKVKTIDDLWSEPEEHVNCIIGPGLLPTVSVGVVTAEPGVGKSWAVLQMAFEIACGRRIFGLFPTTRCTVCYIELERQNAITRSRVKDPTCKQEYPDAGQWFFYWDTDMMMLSTREGKRKLEEIVMSCGAKLIIIDSLSVTIHDQSSHAANSQAFLNIKALAVKYGISFLCIQHLRKRGSGFDQRSGKFVTAPLQLDELTGAKNLHYGVDLAFGLLKNGSNKRDLVFLKHTNSPVQYQDMPPITFDFGQGMPIPYRIHGTKVAQTMMLEFLDLSGPATMNDLEQLLNISRPTLRSTVDELEDLGLVEKQESVGGRNKPTTIIPILDAKHAERIVKKRFAANAAKANP